MPLINKYAVLNLGTLQFSMSWESLSVYSIMKIRYPFRRRSNGRKKPLLEVSVDQACREVENSIMMKTIPFLRSDLARKI